MGVGGCLVVRDTFCLEVRLQVSIATFASMVSTERSMVSLRLALNLFTERFHEVT